MLGAAGRSPDRKPRCCRTTEAATPPTRRRSGGESTSPAVERFTNIATRRRRFGVYRTWVQPSASARSKPRARDMGVSGLRVTRHRRSDAHSSQGKPMFTLRKGRVGMLAAGSMIIAGLGATGALAAGTPVPTPWSSATAPTGTRRRTRTPPTACTSTREQSDVTGPQRAPFGTGSHQDRRSASPRRRPSSTAPTRTTVSRSSDLTRLEYSTFARTTARRRRPSADVPAPQRRHRRRR